MGRSKGKVDEKSLDVLKKKLKGGKEKKKKPVTPKPRGRSRSRSRTPSRARKVTPTPPPPPKKKAAERKSTVKKPVKRLEEPTKPARKTAASKSRSRGGAAAVDSSTVKTPGSYKLRPRVQPSDHEISSSTKSYEGGDVSTSSRSGRAGESQVNGSGGWFSRCIIV